MFRTSHISTEFVSNFGSVVLQEINCNVKTQRTQTTDAKWWQYPTLTFGPDELKKIKTEIYWKIFYFKYLYSIAHDHFRNIQSCKETINQLPHNTVFKLEQLLWLKWTVKPQRGKPSDFLIIKEVSYYSGCKYYYTLLFFDPVFTTLFLKLEQIPKMIRHLS